eukprot:CAMPEP_0171712468 /NCGR_PEP_ID=MMETSP0991-20121206/17185_1 /TAXON_ID=483369 /ORGANISM="non described non described, Strain CCMP2098" /LENGTH=753 /DNA_ID=CAMNT_0012302959 /DNA_START=101 /DNA_END=2362 /DNA_ORIENTATION=-
MDLVSVPPLLMDILALVGILSILSCLCCGAAWVCQTLCLWCCGTPQNSRDTEQDGTPEFNPESNPPSCPNNTHSMACSDGSSGHYREYLCHRCGSGGAGMRWFCAPCDADVCFDCQPPPPSLALEGKRPAGGDACGCGDRGGGGVGQGIELGNAHPLSKGRDREHGSSFLKLADEEEMKSDNDIRAFFGARGSQLGRDEEAPHADGHEQDRQSRRETHASVDRPHPVKNLFGAVGGDSCGLDDRNHEQDRHHQRHFNQEVTQPHFNAGSGLAGHRPDDQRPSDHSEYDYDDAPHRHRDAEAPTTTVTLTLASSLTSEQGSDSGQHPQQLNEGGGGGGGEAYTLPPGWSAHLDDSAGDTAGRTYYCFDPSGYTTWDPPPSEHRQTLLPPQTPAMPLWSLRGSQQQQQQQRGEEEEPEEQPSSRPHQATPTYSAQATPPFSTQTTDTTAAETETAAATGDEMSPLGLSARRGSNKASVEEAKAKAESVRKAFEAALRGNSVSAAAAAADNGDSGDGGNRHSNHHPETNTRVAAAAAAALPPGWSAHSDDSAGGAAGRMYYCFDPSGYTTWDPPLLSDPDPDQTLLPPPSTPTPLGPSAAAAAGTTSVEPSSQSPDNNGDNGRRADDVRIFQGHDPSSTSPSPVSSSSSSSSSAHAATGHQNNNHHRDAHRQEEGGPPEHSLLNAQQVRDFSSLAPLAGPWERRLHRPQPVSGANGSEAGSARKGHYLDSHCMYFFNAETGESSWDEPFECSPNAI